jgi:streptogramin lyase
VTGIDVPLRVAAADGSVWATAFRSGELGRIDASTGAVTGRVPVGRVAEGVTVGLGSVWVVAQDAGRLVRVDPATATVVGTADIGVGARLVSTGPGAVWVSNYQNGTVLKIDPASLAVTTSPRVCGGPQGIAATSGEVWVACTLDSTVVRVDPSTLAVTAKLATPAAPDGLAIGADGRLGSWPSRVRPWSSSTGTPLAWRAPAYSAPFRSSTTRPMTTSRSAPTPSGSPRSRTTACIGSTGHDGLRGLRGPTTRTDYPR